MLTQTITEPSSSQSFTDVNGLQIVGSTVSDKDWDQHVGGGHLRADLSQLNDRDTSAAITFQWYADDLAISGATTSDLILEDYNISPETIYLLASYSTLSGEQVTVTSPTLEQGDWRIFSGGEDGTIAGSNPAPFMETYSFSNSSRTHNGDGWYEDRILASDTHSITSVGAAEVGLSAIEGDSIIRIAATDGSKRSELGNRNWNTRLQENHDLYFAESLYLPKEEWDVVTQYSTLIFQHKQYPGADPNFEVRLSNEGDYKLFVQSPYGHYGLTGDKHNDHTIATLSPDTWHDLKIHLTPSQDDSLGQVTIYLDGETIFSETGTNLNDRDNTNDSFLKLGMYTNIEDSRHYYVDSVEMSTFIRSTVSDWAAGAGSENTDLQTPSSVNISIADLAPTGLALEFVALNTSSKIANAVNGTFDFSNLDTFSHIVLESSAYIPDISISDVVSSLKHIVGLSTLEGAALHAADVDNDDTVAIADVISQLKHIVGLETLNTFDLVDPTGRRLTEITESRTDVKMVLNGDVDLSTALNSEYVYL